MTSTKQDKATEPNELDKLREQMQALQAKIVEQEAAELQVKRLATYPRIAGMLPGVAEKVEAVSEAIKAKDATQVNAAVMGLLGYVGEIRTVSADLGVSPARRPVKTGNGEPRSGSYADQALEFLATHSNQTAAEIAHGCNAAAGGGMSAALARLTEQGKITADGSPRRYSLAPATVTA